jgi:hypothetical protein
MHVLSGGEPLFRATESREREREAQRMQLELSAATQRASALVKELRAARAAAGRKEAEAARELAASRKEAAEELEVARRALADATTARQAVRCHLVALVVRQMRR